MGNFVTSKHAYATLTATYYVWKLMKGIYNITCLQENTTTRQLWLTLTCLAVKEKLNTFLRTVSNLCILLSMVCVCTWCAGVLWVWSGVYTYTVYDSIRLYTNHLSYDGPATGYDGICIAEWLQSIACSKWRWTSWCSGDTIEGWS